MPGRKRVYESDTERKRAYREKLRLKSTYVDANASLPSLRASILAARSVYVRSLAGSDADDMVKRLTDYFDALKV